MNTIYCQLNDEVLSVCGCRYDPAMCKNSLTAWRGEGCFLPWPFFQDHNSLHANCRPPNHFKSPVLSLALTNAWTSWMYCFWLLILIWVLNTTQMHNALGTRWILYHAWWQIGTGRTRAFVCHLLIFEKQFNLVIKCIVSQKSVGRYCVYLFFKQVNGASPRCS